MFLFTVILVVGCSSKPSDVSKPVVSIEKEYFSEVNKKLTEEELIKILKLKITDENETKTTITNFKDIDFSKASNVKVNVSVKDLAGNETQVGTNLTIGRNAKTFYVYSQSVSLSDGGEPYHDVDKYKFVLNSKFMTNYEVIENTNDSETYLFLTIKTKKSSVKMYRGIYDGGPDQKNVESSTFKLGNYYIMEPINGKSYWAAITLDKPGSFIGIYLTTSKSDENLEVLKDLVKQITNTLELA
jgi:hypothetical protein